MIRASIHDRIGDDGRGAVTRAVPRPTEAELRRGEAACWGQRPDAPSAAKPGMRLLEFKPIAKGALRGFCRIELPNGLVIHDAMVFASHGKTWANLPSKPQIGQDGQLKRDASGKLAYSPILEWRDADLRKRFSDALVALVRVEHPGIFEDLP
jgi:hypothetical protein